MKNDPLAAFGIMFVIVITVLVVIIWGLGMLAIAQSLGEDPSVPIICDECAGPLVEIVETQTLDEVWESVHDRLQRADYRERLIYDQSGRVHHVHVWGGGYFEIGSHECESCIRLQTHYTSRFLADTHNLTTNYAAPTHHWILNDREHKFWKSFENSSEYMLRLYPEEIEQ